MATQLKLGVIDVNVVRKDVRHLRLRILEPSFEVQLSVPRYMPLELAKSLAMTKHDWLQQRLHTLRLQHAAMYAQTQTIPSTMLVWGNRVKLAIQAQARANWVGMRNGELHVDCKAVAAPDEIAVLIERWQRNELQLAIPELVTKWEQRMQTTSGPVIVQRMKTRWGTCNMATRRIRLNLELAKKPAHLLEYVLVHEMTHFFHGGHGREFRSAMDLYLPNWRALQKELQCFPRL